MRSLRLALIAMTASCAWPASAAEPVRGVVELFTSQGCSSCPPADRLLTELAKSPDLIALTFSVDYWDYIGWKDTFADPAFTARQKGYAAVRGDGQVYTPQAVIDGVTHVIGSDQQDIEGALTSSLHRRGALTVPVTVAMAGGKVSVDIAGAAPDGPSKAVVWLLDTIPEKTVAIGRGENSGRSVTYANVVRKISRLGNWDGKPAHFELMSRLNANGYVVLLQASDPGPGPILGAAKGP